MALLKPLGTLHSITVAAKHPRVEIEYCTQCRWLLRAAWMAQELLTTFAAELGEDARDPAADRDVEQPGSGSGTPRLIGVGGAGNVQRSNPTSRRGLFSPDHDDRRGMWRSKRHLESGIGGDTECRIARWIGGRKPDTPSTRGRA